MVVPRAIGDDVVGVFPVHLGKFRRHVLLVDVEQILLVAQHFDVDAFGRLYLFLGQFGFGHIHRLVLFFASSCH